MSQLLSNLPVGAKVKDPESKFNGVPVVWIVGEHNHYASGQTVLISEKVLQFMCFDAIEKNGGASSRNSYGNANYPVSNIDQWLNSDAGAGAWWSATHSYDQAPTNANVRSNYNEYDAKPGFLNGFSAKFKNALVAANLPYKQPANEGGSVTTVSRKVFLPSAEEIGGSVNSEGSIISYFSGGVAGAYPTSQAVANAEYDSSSYISTSVMAYYWLRTCYNNYTGYVQKYNTSAPSPYYYNTYSVNYLTYSYNGTYQGVRPLVNLVSSINVSDTADSDGVYEIIWNTPPTMADIPAKGEQKITPFNIAYTASDIDGDALTITATLNGNAIYSKANVASGSTQNIQITKTMIDNYGVNGTNTVVVTASDGMASVSKTTTFLRSQTELVIQGAEVISYDEMPTEMGVRLVANVPDGATMFVFCCNNANDANPIWEDCTEETLNREMHTFTNTNKTAEKWGVNIRIVIQKGTATEKATISGFGGVL